MTAPDRWRRVDEVFTRALELEAGERRAFVDQAARGDPELRGRVLELLAAEENAGPFLDSPVEECCDVPWQELFPVAGERGRDPPAPEDDRVGEAFGAYRIVRRIGRGGMASVYLAERADGLFEQQVAIKVLRRGLDTDDVVRRFLAERQILSSLSHPNIARVFDGGATPDGLPYLVMEFVDGTPVVDWCDDRGLGLRERLRLFCDIGRAVQHAHRSLVVHRDLKPSNILVDAGGNVKLLDFGVAKLLDDRHPEATRTGIRAMTPGYASPELVLGEPITTASDVYQLGLVLCRLVAGRLPYDVTALSPARAERQVTEAVPARASSLVSDEAAASRATSRRDLARALSGDLDQIILQALRSEPEARYASAEALVEDVERHLHHEPVRARPDSLSYRARKFIGRNRGTVVAAALLFVVLAGSALVATVQASRLAVERDRAVVQEHRAEQVTAFLAEMFQVTDPNEGTADAAAAEALLARGAERAMRELTPDPAAEAEVLSAIGDMYVKRALFDEAVPLLERAIGLRRAIDDNAEGLVGDLLLLARAVEIGDRPRSIRLAEEGVAVAERELGPDHRMLAAALTALADAIETGPRMEDSRERAVAILRAHPGDVREELAAALHFSALGGGMDRFDRLVEALEIRRELFGEDHTGVAAILNDMALKLEPFDAHAADTLLERAAEINVRIHGPTHSQTLQILNNLAGRYRDRGDYEKALPLYREILRRREEAYPDDMMGIAFTKHGLGWCLSELDRADEAEIMLREVVDVVRTGHEGYETVHQVARSTLGRSLAVQGRYQEAEPLLRDSYEWLVENDPLPVFLPHMLDRLIALYDAWGRPAAADHYRAQIEVLESAADSEVVASR